MRRRFNGAEVLVLSEEQADAALLEMLERAKREGAE